MIVHSIIKHHSRTPKNPKESQRIPKNPKESSVRERQESCILVSVRWYCSRCSYSRSSLRRRWIKKREGFVSSEGERLSWRRPIAWPWWSKWAVHPSPLFPNPFERFSFLIALRHSSPSAPLIFRFPNDSQLAFSRVEMLFVDSIGWFQLLIWIKPVCITVTTLDWLPHYGDSVDFEWINSIQFKPISEHHKVI